MFDKLKLIDNIYAVAKLRGKNIGELEQSSEISRGYLSRLTREGNTTNPPIELIVSLAEKLNISIDTLINGDLLHLSKREQFVYDFIHKLRIMTEEGKIDWLRKEVYLQMNGFDSDICYSCDSDVYNTWFKSEFVNSYTVKENVAYFAQLPNSEKKVMILNITYTDESEEKHDAAEVYIMTRAKGNAYSKCEPICSTAFTVEELKKEIEELNNNVFGARSRIGLTDNTKSVIDAFLNDVSEEQDPFLEEKYMESHIDDDLPFN